MGQFAYEVDTGNFQARVIDASRQVPVVVDFWAAWCGPCRALKPILEKLADEFQGRFILAKVDSDRNPELAARFGVRGIPSVKAVVDGEVVDEFSGALPESAVREFLARIIPSPAEELRRAAAEQRAAGDLAAALATLGEASRLDPANEAVRMDAAEVLLDQGQAEEARRLLDTLPPASRLNGRPQQLFARLGFALGGRRADEASLRERIADQPADMQARLDLANLLAAAGRHREGLDELLAMVRLDRQWNDEAARKAVLAIFNLLGGQGELVSHYRRQLARALN